MARLRWDAERRVVEVDLHGYGATEARRMARQAVQEAWENGFRQIVLIHGAAAARQAGWAWQQGYGVVKWQLRGQFQQGRWRQYLYHNGSRKHRLEAGAMHLAVRPNPTPREEISWTPLAEPRRSPSTPSSESWANAATQVTTPLARI